MLTDYSRKGRNYEYLIRRAFNCDKGNKHGADSKLLEDLYHLECDEKDCFLYRRRFNKLKINIEKALCKLKKRKKYYNSQDEFMPFLLMLNKVTCVDDLAEVSTKSLSKIIECENRLRQSG